MERRNFLLALMLGLSVPASALKALAEEHGLSADELQVLLQRRLCQSHCPCSGLSGSTRHSPEGAFDAESTRPKNQL